MKPWLRILCAVDGSESSFSSAEQARSLAKRLGAELLHLFVIPTNLAVLPGPPLQPEVRQALNESAEELLADLARRAKRGGVTTREHIVEGDPAEAIIKAATRFNADVITMAAKGAGGGRWLLGSNTAKTIQFSPVPVLVVRGEEPHKGYRRILSCIDGSSESEFAARCALLVAKAYGADLSLCHVAHVATDKIPGLARDERFIEEKEREWIEMQMANVTEAAQAEGCKYEVKYLTGNPADAILAHADEWKADLITIGSRGLGGFARLTLGSTSYHVTQYASASVLVAHRPRH